jgi:hypothetical protein
MTNRFGGRPKLPREQIRDQRVVTFLTGDERKLLEKIAGESSVSVSRACHDLIVKGMDGLSTSQLVTASNRSNKT